MVEIVTITNPYGVQDNVLCIDNTGSSTVSYTFGDILEIDNEYTFSCWFKAEANTTVSIYISNDHKDFIVTTEWDKLVFTTTSDIANSKEVLFTIASGATIYAYQGQLEIGNKDTDFRLNQKDIQDSITQVDNKVTVLQTDFSVEQGKISTLISETETLKNTVEEVKSSAENANSKVNEVQSSLTTLTNRYNQTEQTVEGNKTSIGNIQTTVNDLTGDVESMESRITTVEATANGLKTTVSKASTDASNAVNTANTANSNANSALSKATNLEQRADSGEFDGIGVVGSIVEYQESTSGTTAPTGTWSTSVPTVASGSYLWTRTTTSYTSGNPTISYSVSKMGADGAKGDKGEQGLNGTSVTVKSTSVTYQKSTSGTTTPTGTWQTSVPSTSAGEYLWTKTVVTYSDNTSTTSYSVSRNGTNGADGKNGTDGTSPTVSSTKIEYQQSTSGTSVPTGTWYTTPPTATAGQYMWTRTTVTYSDSKTSVSYSVSKNGTNGSNGTNGKDGTNGSDGKGISSITNYYLATSSSSGVTTSTSGWQTTPQTVTSTNRYHWHYQVYNYTIGSPTTTTPAIIGVYGDTGSQGSTGATGKGIKSVQPQYYLSTSNTTQTGGSWKTTQDAWSSGKYYWTRDAITWTDNTTTYTTPMLATGLNNANNTANSAQTVANQTAEKFTWLVKSGTSSTDFELTDRTATLVSNNINLKGLVTFSGLNADTQNKINNAQSTADAANSKADSAQETANSANTNASNAQLTANNVKVLTDAWVSDAITEGIAKINGGYIQAQTIDTNHLIVEDIFAEGSAVMNIINAQEIDANRITGGLIRATLLELYGLRLLQKVTELETLSISDDGEVTLRGNVESYNYHAGKTGWSINGATNSGEFNDMTLRGSLITNDGGIASSGGSGINLQKNTSFPSTLANWSRGSNYSVDQDFQYNGTNSVKFERSGLTANSVQYIYSGNNKIPCTVGTSYTAQAVFYTEDVDAIDGDKIIFGIYFYTSDATSAGTFRKTVPFVNNEWIYLTVTAEAPEDAAYVAIVVGSYRNGTFWFAQPKLEEGDVATPYSISPEDGIKQVRFWAGASYEERESAPAIIYNDGSVKFVNGEYNGLVTGNIEIGNISIIDPSKTAGNDAILTIQNGDNGVKKIQLTDTESSSFAQNLIITDDFYNTVIALNQDGTGMFSNGIAIGSNTTLKETSLVMNGFTLKTGSTGYVFDVPQVNIGSTSSDSLLKVYGESYLNGIVHIEKTINFNDVVECTVSSNGIDFNFIN